MFQNISMRVVDRAFYTRMYELESNLFDGQKVYLYAECSNNPKKYDETINEFYHMEFLFSVGDNPDREFIYGVYFGDGPMEQQDIDEFADERARFHMGTLPSHVKSYMERYQLWYTHVDKTLGLISEDSEQPLLQEE